MNKKELIKIENLSFAYPESEATILKDINLTICQGDFVGIIGKNGSGKSTLLKLILKILRPQKGSIIIKENTNVGYVEQISGSSENFIPASVMEIVLLGLYSKVGPFKWFNKSDKELARKVIKLVGLKGHEETLINRLSGGQQQKVAIAKALIADPDLLILDEPTTGVDKEGETEFIELLKHLHRAHGKTIVLVTHDLSKLKAVNNVYALEDGQIKEVTNV